jgi:RHS repeat-associated protein
MVLASPCGSVAGLGRRFDECPLFLSSGTPVREMDFTLDPTGNWSSYLTKTSGTTDLTQTRTSNKVNEITAFSSTPTWSTPPAYDAAGNMTSFPQPASPSSAFTTIYDAWNRMTSISSGGSVVATYQYDGRGRRIVKVTTATSETRHFYYTDRWQGVEERVGSSTTMDKQHVWGIRYVDELVCRDDATPARLYACQDANFNLTAITDTSGNVVERYAFDPYGSRAIMNASWSVISISTYGWTNGHQGLTYDEESGLIFNNARYLNPILGCFLQRDWLEYLAGANLYEYERSSAPNLLDATGAYPTDSQHCLDLADRIHSLTREIQKREDEYKQDDQQLPWDLPGQPNRFTRMGHVRIIGFLKGVQAGLIARYENECQDPPPPSSCPVHITVPSVPKLTPSQTQAVGGTLLIGGVAWYWWLLAGAAAA